jgi:hypothetical protein
MEAAVSEWLSTVLTSTAVSTALVGVLVVLFQSLLVERLKSAIQAEYNEKLETHKAKLKAESDVAQERLRAQLQTAAVQANVTFQRLHERRFQAIEVVYDKLHELYRAADARVISVFGLASESGIEELRVAMADFQATCLPLLLFLPASLEDQLRLLSNLILRMSRKLDQADDLAEDTKYDKWHEDVHTLVTDVQAAFFTIKTEMRRLLGEDPGSETAEE